MLQKLARKRSEQLLGGAIEVLESAKSITFSSSLKFLHVSLEASGNLVAVPQGNADG